MTCKDCYGCEICAEFGAEHLPSDLDSRYFEYKDIDNVEQECSCFKEKSRIVELPNIEIGQELFYIDKYGKRVESDTVSKLTFEKNDLGIDTGVWSDNYGFSEFFSDVGKTLFLTKEEAEEKLKELKK